MLYWTLIFLVVALVAGLFGFGGIASASAGIAKVLFAIFLVLFLVSLIFGVVRGSLGEAGCGAAPRSSPSRRSHQAGLPHKEGRAGQRARPQVAAPSPRAHGEFWFDPTQLPSFTGTVERYLLNPRGETDALIFREGPQIVFPPDIAAAVRQAAPPGRPLVAWGIRARSAPVITMLAFAPSATRRRRWWTASTGGSAAASRWSRRRGSAVAGIVKQPYYTPQGEVAGAVLEDGTVIVVPQGGGRGCEGPAEGFAEGRRQAGGRGHGQRRRGGRALLADRTGRGAGRARSPCRAEPGGCPSLRCLSLKCPSLTPCRPTACRRPTASPAASAGWPGSISTARRSGRARLLAAGVLALTLLQIGIQVRFNIWNRDFFNALEQRDRPGLLRPDGPVRRADAWPAWRPRCFQLYVRQTAAAALAGMAGLPAAAPLAGGRPALPARLPRRRRRQPGPADQREYPLGDGHGGGAGDRADHLGADAGLLRRHPVDPVGAAACRRSARPSSTSPATWSSPPCSMPASAAS